MGFKKLPFSDQLSYGGVHTKRKVFSSFGLGLGTSLIILSLIFLYCPVNVSLFNFNPIFQTSSSSLPSWPFSYSSTSSSSSSLELQKNKEEKVEAKTDQRNILNGSRNANISQFEGTPQKGNFSVGVENARIQKSHDGDSSENGKNGTLFSGEEPHEENISERSKNSSFLDFNGGERSHEGNSSKKEKIDGLGSEGVANEKTQLGSSDIDGKNSSFYGNANQINDEKSPKKKPTEIEKIEDSLGKEKRVSKKTDEEIQKGNFSENSKVLNAYNGDGDLKDLPDLSEKCNIFEGKWVRDERKPYYPAGSCPHIDRDFDCHLNGRPDDDFLRWRWQPNDCNIPSFNATDFLERLRGKRLIFVGDSLNRNMWESLVCMLRHGVADKKRVHEVSGRSEFKVRGCYAFRYEDYNCSVDFVSAPFLVRENVVNGQNGSVETLRLDKMDMTTSSYRTADVIVFNTGHWWTHEKTSKGENYYQEGTHVYPKLEVIDAFKKAMITWGRWIDKKIDPKRTQVLFRGYSPTHFSGGQWNSGGQCHKETDPIFNNTYLAEYPPKMKVIEDVIKQMKIPVQYLNISKLTDYRKDGHPSIYRKEYKTEKEWAEAVQSQDCSHWCLPGVPDTWNELLYASLLQSGEGSWKY